MSTEYKQEPPNCVQVELVEGCNLACGFCGINGIRDPRDKAHKYMDLATVYRLAQGIREAGWTCRLELAMHGEPTMHPGYAEAVAILRRELPRHHIMLTSNGGGLLRKPGPVARILELFQAGLNVLALDDYQHASIVSKIRQALGHPTTEYNAALQGACVQVWEYPEQKEGNPHTRRRPHERHLVFIADISQASNGNHSMLSNHCGAAFPLSSKAEGRRCAKPFRELAVRWDGNVAVCCNDWRGYFKVGNVLELGLEGVWQHPVMQAARRKLYHGQRDVGPCVGCDFLSYRTGLLPDRYGKGRLPLPDAQDELAIRQALAGGPYTPAVLRPWEQGAPHGLVQLGAYPRGAQ